MSLYIIDGVRNVLEHHDFGAELERGSAREMPIAEFLLPLDRNPASIHGLSRDFVRSSRQIQKPLPVALEVAL